MRSSFPAVVCARLVLRLFCTSRCVPLVVLVGRPPLGLVRVRGTVIWREGRRHHPCRCAEAHPPWFFAVAEVIDVLVCRSCRFFQVVARCVQGQVPSKTAVHQQGHLPFRGAEANPHDQAVQQTIEIPLLPYTRWLMSLFTGRADFPSRGPDCSSDHRDSAVLLRQGDRCPCCTGRLSRRFLSWCRGRFPWSGLLSDQRDSPVSPRQGDRRPCCDGRASW